jgi:hypothetical protein
MDLVFLALLAALAVGSVIAEPAPESGASNQFDFDAPRAAWFQGAFQLLIAYLAYKTQQDAIDKQDAIARRIQNRADGIYNIWQTNYLPCELATLAEICNQPLYVPQYEAVKQRAIAAVKSQFAAVRKQATYCLDAQCVGQKCEIDRTIDLEEARSVGFAIQAAYRAEESRKDLKDAQRLNDRLNVSNVGRGYVANSNSALNSAAQLFQQSAQQAQNQFNGLAQDLGNVFRTVTQPRDQQRPEIYSPTNTNNNGTIYETGGFGGNNNRGIGAVDYLSGNGNAQQPSGVNPNIGTYDNYSGQVYPNYNQPSAAPVAANAFDGSTVLTNTDYSNFYSNQG